MAATCATSYVKAAPAAPAHGSSSINKGREDGRQSHICAVSLATWVGVAMVTSEPKNTMWSLILLVIFPESTALQYNPCSYYWTGSLFLMELMHLWLVFLPFVSVVFQVPQMIKASGCIESGSLICPEENLISLIYLHTVPRMQTSTGERKSLYYICCNFFKLLAWLCFDRLSPAAKTGSDMSWSKGLNAFSFISFLFVVVVVSLLVIFLCFGYLACPVFAWLWSSVSCSAPASLSFCLLVFFLFNVTVHRRTEWRSKIQISNPKAGDGHAQRCSSAPRTQHREFYSKKHKKHESRW